MVLSSLPNYCDYTVLLLSFFLL
uniref:Uncharacterized protein n=1 Tax=Rhizophora mucronata TaxID=61149 RepID=A0A2P2QHN0_RHIMU